MSNLCPLRYWRGKAGEWKKAAEAAKEELDEFQEGSRLGISIARLLSPINWLLAVVFSVVIFCLNTELITIRELEAELETQLEQAEIKTKDLKVHLSIS